MKDFSTSLIREKVSFVDGGRHDNPALGQTADGVVLRSNRITLPLENENGKENIVIRAQTTSLALMLAHKVLYSFYRTGLFKVRDQPYDWQGVWDSVLSDYERAYNPNAWCCIYRDGDPVFRTLDIPYMDVIEKCALLDLDNYDAAFSRAEEAMRKLGMKVSIDTELSVSAVFNDNRSEGKMRCGIIQRGKAQKMTFNYVVVGGEKHLRIEQSILAAAHLLEAINLKLCIQDLQSRKRGGEILQASAENRKLRAAAARSSMLFKAVSNFEENFDVHYRPEKPDIGINISER